MNLRFRQKCSPLKNVDGCFSRPDIQPSKLLNVCLSLVISFIGRIRQWPPPSLLTICDHAHHLPEKAERPMQFQSRILFTTIQILFVMIFSLITRSMSDRSACTLKAPVTRCVATVLVWSRAFCEHPKLLYWAHKLFRRQVQNHSCAWRTFIHGTPLCAPLSWLINKV